MSAALKFKTVTLPIVLELYIHLEYSLTVVRYQAIGTEN